jgi:hypothetical protein
MQYNSAKAKRVVRVYSKNANKHHINVNMPDLIKHQKLNALRRHAKPIPAEKKI